MEHLKERGHRRLAFAASFQPELERQSGLRQRSVERRASELGLAEVQVSPVRSDGSDAASVVQAGHEAGVTGVCANNDEVALAVLRGIRAARLRCPEDLSVIGYDATVVGAVADPPAHLDRLGRPIGRALHRRHHPRPDAPSVLP